MRQKLIYLANIYLPPLLWAAMIYLLSAQSSLPSFEVSLYDFLFKKCSHMFVYGVLYILLYRAVNKPPLTKQKNWALPFIICFCYAALDELHQSFTPYRSPTLRDIGYDLLGSGIAFLKLYNYI